MDGIKIKYSENFKEILNDILKTNIGADFKETRLGDVLHSRADISKAKELLRFETKISLEESVDEVIQYIKEKNLYI